MAHASLGFGWQLAGGAMVAAVSAYSMTPVFFPGYVRRFHQKLNNDTLQPEAVDERTLSLLDDVLTEVKMPKSKEESIDVFITSGLSPRYFGSFGQRTMCLLGLPVHLRWCTDDDFEANKAVVLKSSFPWSQPGADAVKSALLLSDDEKKFVMARQLGYLDTNHVWVKYGQRLFGVSAGFVIAHMANIKLGLLRGEKSAGLAVAGSRPARLAGAIYGLCVFGGLGFSNLMNDAYNCHIDSFADKYAGTISPCYSQAGYSYYNKLIDANRVMREVIPNGHRKFTVVGNEVTGSFRVKTLSLMSRRDYMKRLHEQQVESSEDGICKVHDSQKVEQGVFTLKRLPEQ